MKPNFFRICMVGGFVSLAAQVTAQQQLPQPLDYETIAPRAAAHSGERATCGDDRIGYALAKNLNGTTFSVYSTQADSDSYLQAASQWFDAPAPLTVKGVWIYAGAIFAPSDLNVSLHTAAADKTPGALLASGTLTAPTTPGWINVTFSSPVVVNGPYVISILNPGSDNANRVRIYANYTGNATTPIYSGRGERLARVFMFDKWMDPDDLFLLGFDADFLFEPVVSYNLVSDFTVSPATLCIDQEVTLTNTSTAIAQSRFYNPKAFNHHFNGVADSTFTWTLADGSTTHTVNATTTFGTAGNATVSLNVNYDLWETSGCTDTKSETLTFTQIDDASFTYASTSFCTSAPNATPAITGGATGSFTSTTGLVFADASIGEIDLAGSTPGTYTVTFTTNGTCPNTATFDIEIEDQLDDASFDYSAASYCADATNPVANITGGSTGTFTATTGLVFEDASTGEIDLAGSTAGGPYTVTFTTNGTCSNTETFEVSITALDDASFAYSAASYCVDATNPVANITGGSTGTFSATTGLVFEDASTGEIDLAGSTAGGPYTVTFTTNGTCSNTETFDVSITALDDASFAYSAASYCVDATNPVANITGGSTGTFTATTGLVFEDASTGEIDLAGSTVGGPYTVTFTTNGTCPNTETFDVSINALPTVTLANGDTTLCATSGLYTLTGGDPAGGTYTVDGTSATTFQPSSGNVGTHTVVYTYTDANGCSASASGTIEVEVCVNVKEQDALSSLKLFPNPTQGIVTIEADNLTQVEVLNTLGGVVLSVAANGASKVTLDIANQPNGIYFVRVFSVNGSVTKKVNLAK